MRSLIRPEEDRRRLYPTIPWEGGFRWFRSPHVVPIERYRQARSWRRAKPDRDDMILACVAFAGGTNMGPPVLVGLSRGAIPCGRLACASPARRGGSELGATAERVWARWHEMPPQAPLVPPARS